MCTQPKTNQQLTIILDAIDFFTSSWISLHVLTPMSGAFFPCKHYYFISKCACVLTCSSSKSRELEFKLRTALLGSLVGGYQSFHGTSCIPLLEVLSIETIYNAKD